MSEETKDEAKPKRKPLTLRKTETGSVNQSFSHGRSKTVVVETKKRRTIAPKPSGTPVHKEIKPAETKAAPAAAPAESLDASKKDGKVLRTLSDTEKKRIAEALTKAKIQEEEKRAREEAERAEREQRTRRRTNPLHQ